jgi:hypothetical protein
MPLFDHSPWSRKHDVPGTAKVPAPKCHYYPATLDDLIQLIWDAEILPGTKDWPEVRSSGSHWSLDDAAVTQDFIVETNEPHNKQQYPRLDQPAPVFDVIPSCMSQEALAWFNDQNMPAFEPASIQVQGSLTPTPQPFYLYHVLSGTRIYDLYSFIDLGDDNNLASLAHAIASKFENQNYFGPWAMDTLGGAEGQTIVGVFSTGTHGGDVGLPPIADFVQAIHLVAPDADVQYARNVACFRGPIACPDPSGRFRRDAAGKSGPASPVGTWSAS